MPQRSCEPVCLSCWPKTYVGRCYTRCGEQGDHHRLMLQVIPCHSSIITRDQYKIKTAKLGGSWNRTSAWAKDTKIGTEALRTRRTDAEGRVALLPNTTTEEVSPHHGAASTLPRYGRVMTAFPGSQEPSRSGFELDGVRGQSCASPGKVPSAPKHHGHDVTVVAGCVPAYCAVWIPCAMPALSMDMISGRRVSMTESTGESCPIKRVYSELSCLHSIRWQHASQLSSNSTLCQTIQYHPEQIKRNTQDLQPCAARASPSSWPWP